MKVFFEAEAYAASFFEVPLEVIPTIGSKVSIPEILIPNEYYQKFKIIGGGDVSMHPDIEGDRVSVYVYDDECADMRVVSIRHKLNITTDQKFEQEVYILVEFLEF